MRALFLGACLAVGCNAGAQTSTPVGAQATAAAHQREDIAAFERDFFDADRSYSTAARVEARRRLDALRANAGAISDTLFVLRLSQIAALADNGHSGVNHRGSAPGMGRVGARLAPFGHEFYVVRAEEGHAEVLGGRLVAIDGTPVAKLREAAHTLTGGTEGHRDQMTPLLLESPGQLHALDLARAATEASYSFEMRDGSRREVSLPVVSAAGGGGSQGGGVLAPDATPEGWRSLLASDKTPWALQEPRETMRRRDLPDLDAIVIQLRANFDAGESIAAFLEQAETARRTAARSNVILDMRMNGGGDLQLTRKWMSELPSRLPKDGRVVILISSRTFSAAIASVGYVKQAGGFRVTLVGEPPGDRLSFFAEGRPIPLPNSGAMVLMATQRHDYVTGCRGYSDCHRYMVKYPISVPNLDPEVDAPWTLDAYAAGRDPGMEAAARILSKGK